jgi:hypothetical protein
LPNNKDAVHWLELPAKGPAKQFAKVKVIQRVDTSGGIAPDKRASSEGWHEQWVKVPSG